MITLKITMTQFRNITYSNQILEGVAQLAGHWASTPKLVGSITTVVRHVFQLARCGYEHGVTPKNIILTRVQDTKIS